MRPHRYKQVMHACCLRSDLRRLPGGDGADVGERGNSLSGGQKARMALARCCYEEADVVLLDDPLAAVDARVARRLVQRCLVALLRRSTRLVVTHAPALLRPHAHLVIALRNGEVHVEDAGGATEGGGEGERAEEEAEDAEAEDSSDAEEESVAKDLGGGEQRNARALWRQRSTVILRNLHALNQPKQPTEQQQQPTEQQQQPTEQLQQAAGEGVAGAVRFLRAGRCPSLLAATLLLHVGAQGMRSAVDFWVGNWVTAQSLALSLGLSASAHVGLFCGAVLLLASLSFVRVWMLRLVCTRAARHLHAAALHAVLRAPMGLYDALPRGQLLGPFGGDLSTLDDRLPTCLSWCSQIVLVLSGVFSVVVASQWQTLAPGVAFAVGAAVTMRRLCTAPKEYKHLEATCLEPQLSLVADTLHGLSTIRSLQRERLFSDLFHRQQDVVTAAAIAFDGTNTAINFLINLLVALLVSANMVVFFIFKDESGAAALGLVFFLSLSVSSILPHLVENVVELLGHAGAVARIEALSRMPREDDSAEGSSAVPEGWPGAGALEFDAVCMRYGASDSQLALKDLSFKIPPGHKVGVVGRTGAGKSSLLSALLRLHAPCSGAVRLGGVDCAAVPLRALRRAVAVVPQEPALFTGPLRLSLDPDGECSDAQLWEALHLVGLAPAPDAPATDVPKGVAASLAKAGLQARLEGAVGSEASAGERQLLCAARALLRPHASLLVLDEASAALDPTADALLHRAFGALKARRTVLAVAHRLLTVADADAVIVMDQGAVAEMGHPHELLQRGPQSAFARMVTETGGDAEDAIRRTAAESWQRRMAVHETAAEGTAAEGSTAA